MAWQFIIIGHNEHEISVAKEKAGGLDTEIKFKLSCIGRYLPDQDHDCGKIHTGLATVSYSRIHYHPRTVQRILQHVPDVRIIYMVRHPIEGFVSVYVERLASVDFLKSYPSVNQAVISEPIDDRFKSVLGSV